MAFFCNFSNEHFLELSMNICKLSSLDNLPKLPSLYKLSLADNNLTSIAGLADKCPALLELSLSGNGKITQLEQLEEISKFSSIMRLDLEGCGVADKDNYREKLFKISETLSIIDSLNQQGTKFPRTKTKKRRKMRILKEGLVLFF